jgi:hypothetical protein
MLSVGFKCMPTLPSVLCSVVITALRVRRLRSIAALFCLPKSIISPDGVVWFYFSRSLGLKPKSAAIHSTSLVRAATTIAANTRFPIKPPVSEVLKKIVKGNYDSK